MMYKTFNSDKRKINKLTLIRTSREYQRSLHIIEWDKFVDSVFLAKS